MSIAVRLALHLPRDAATVPVVRRLLDQALHTLGVDPSCCDDVGLILTEACANVIEHAQQIDDYEIGVDVTGERCVIHVINAGGVVDPARLVPVARPDPVTSGSVVSGSVASPRVAPGLPGLPALSGAAAVPEPRAEAVFDPVLDEHGRGLHIIRSLADELYVTPSLSGGLVLQAVTTLRWTADAALWRRR
ncbi:ATP-binding protein [Dactylosporangium sp. CA-092794]|uniref:ATP-binding protein n=1 Tax=Dactylosporangium sp. CA-092794 TaxID=3239929 RepID=UPI003D8E56DB